MSSGCNRRYTLLPLQLATLALAGSALSAQVLAPNLLYTSMQPCRLFDTRVAGGELVANTNREFNAVGVSSAGSLSSQGGNPSGCPIPGFDVDFNPQVQAIIINLAVVTPSGTGVLQAWPSDQSEPNASVMNFTAAEVVLANGVILPVRQNVQGGDITLVSNVGTHVLGDVVGYFSAGSPVQGSGAYNLFLGRGAGNPSVSTASNNMAIGFQSLKLNETGSGNTALGTQALYYALGSFNIAVGYNVGNAYTGSEEGNILIGASGVTGESFVTRIGDQGSQVAAIIAGIYSETVGATYNAVYIDNTGKLGTGTSSIRFKEDVRDMGEASDDLMRLRPVTFHYKAEYDDGSHLLQYGLIAEEVAKVIPGLVQLDAAGEPLSVRYHLLGAMLLNEAQKQHATIATQADRIATQSAQLDQQRQRLDTQEATIASQAAQLRAQQARLDEFAAQLAGLKVLIVNTH
jgi:Chaperone of endosialidase